MTIEEFDNTEWTGQMKCEYKGKGFDIVLVDFEEKIIAINETDTLDYEGYPILDWKRCENITIIN